MGLSIQNIVIIFLSLTSVIFAALYFRSLFRLKRTVKISAELLFANQALEQKIFVTGSDDVPDVHKENFIKFLSDSRDWAFSYIEDVQNKLKAFIDLADKQFAYFDKYGVLIEGQPHYDTLKIMSEECKKLKDLLPEDLDDRR